MKIKLNSKQKIQRKQNSSLERLKVKKKPIIIHSPQLALKTSNNPKYISIATQNTEPKRRKQKKLPQQEPQFLKEFEEITYIYQKSKEVENQEEEIDFMCREETLDDSCHKRNKSKSYYSISNRYSQKSANLLPSIAQKDQQEEKEDDFIETIVKAKNRSPGSTATHRRTKNTKSANDNYVNDFEIKTKSASREKKMTIDVQRVIVSRSKAKSSASNKNGKKQKR